MNTTKTYGADGNKFKHTDQDAIERFWRHLLAGAASIRFHRPDSGLGINDKAVACLKAARMLEEIAPLWSVDPRDDILDDRNPNEAYAAASEDESVILIFFPKADESGEVTLTPRQARGRHRIAWIDIDQGSVLPEEAVELGASHRLRAPGQGNFVAALTRVDR